MSGLTPEVRGRIAFAALFFALALVAADRTVASGDPSPLFLFAPAIAVAGTGHVGAREAAFRAGLSAVLMAAAGALASLSQGRGLPEVNGAAAFLSVLVSLFGINLVVIVLTSAVLRRAWPASDHWTR